MKKKMQFGVCSALLIGSLVGGLGTGDLAVYASSNDVTNKVAQQVSSQFKDVATDSYSYDAIKWGKRKGLISGYTGDDGKPNGYFGPNDNVTEAQFVKMVANYLGLKDTDGNLVKNDNHGAHWSDTHYDAMAKHGVPLNGYFDNAIRSQPMKRGSVAQALGYLLGDSVDLTKSINFLLENGITTGQNPQFEGNDLSKFFGSTNNLTRGQVITFLYRMDNKNLNNISSIADMNASDTINLNAKAKEGYSYVDVSIGGSKNPNNANSNDNDNDKYANFFGPDNSKQIDEVKNSMPKDDIDAKYKGVKQKTETPLSKELKSKLGEDKIGLNYIGFDDYIVDAEYNDLTLFGLAYNERVPLIDDGDSVGHDEGKFSISFIKRNEKFYDLEDYSHNLINLFKYTGLSDKESKDVFNEFKIMFDKDVKTLRDSVTGHGYYTEYKFILNKKVLISYEPDLVFIIIY